MTPQAPVMSSTLAVPIQPSIADHLHPYHVPPTSYSEYFILSPNRTQTIRSHLVASAAVLHRGRILLLQRAAHGFQGLLWELPGGRCEPRDETVIASAVRELWEESGLVATKVVDIVGDYEWLDREERWKKITFLVVVENERDGSEWDSEAVPGVTIDPEEQEASLWATEEEVRADKCGNIELNWTSVEQKEMALNAFRLSR